MAFSRQATLIILSATGLRAVWVARDFLVGTPMRRLSGMCASGCSPIHRRRAKRPPMPSKPEVSRPFRLFRLASSTSAQRIERIWSGGLKVTACSCGIFGGYERVTDVV